MSKYREPDRDYSPDEQQRSFLQRRYHAFADRSRDPGDAVTWAVVLGALICTLLVICFAVADERGLVVVPLLGIALWIFVVSYFGRVNIFAILWGASAADAKSSPKPVFVLLPTLVLALVSLIIVFIDAATGWDFRWYGLALGITSVCYLILFLRTLSRD